MNRPRPASYIRSRAMRSRASRPEPRRRSAASAGPLCCAVLLAVGFAAYASAAAGPGHSTAAAGDDSATARVEPHCAPSSDPGVTGSQPGFAVRFDEEVSPCRLISHMVLPGETFELDIQFADSTSFVACRGGSALAQEATGGWVIEAPAEPGHYDIDIVQTTTGLRSTLRLFVLVPYQGQERLGDFVIGSYQRQPLRNLDSYRVPRGFIRVEPHEVDLAVSDNFALGQFLSKQRGDFPKYARVSTRMLLKIERLLEEVRSRGIEADTFVIMSAFRTPWYNESIGNTTEYSRHLYGDAVDLYIDDDHDGRMDDLDGDGRSTYDDAKLLASVLEQATSAAWYQPFVGGLGIYGPKPHRGPFVHVDTRGYRARWTSP